VGVQHRGTSPTHTECQQSDREEGAMNMMSPNK
jgi:hypothetical protein